MDRGELQNTLKRLCNVMWEANVTNPITYVTQISYLLFLKMLEEMDAEQKEAGNGKHKSLFAKFKQDGRELDYTPLRWSVLTSNPDNEKMLRTLRDTLPLLAEHPRLSATSRAVFQNAAVVIPNGAALRRAVDVIAPISFLAFDADVKGDLFELLVSDLGGQKKAAQFRTPRHLIRVITKMVDPQIGQTVCDPACGSGGFLIAAYDHILLANTSPDLVRETAGPDGLPVRRGIGDKLTRAQWNFLQKGMFHGFESDPDILRLAAMNAVLHQFDESPLACRDSICGSEDRWDEVQFDVILENPPFSGVRGDAKRSLRVEKGDKYVLFLAHALRSLRPGGRAGIIFTNGILFGDTDSHLVVKKRLLSEFDLQAVVSLPRGAFEPYTSSATCFLVFQKTGKPTERTWFYRVEGDGSSLSKGRKFGSQFRNDLPDLLAKWARRETQEGRAWVVPAERIIANNYNMTLAALGLAEPEADDHSEPAEIFDAVIRRHDSAKEVLRQMRQALRDASTIFECQDWPVYQASRLFTAVAGQVDPREKPYADMPHVGPDSIEAGTGRLLRDTIQTPRQLGLKSGKYLFGPEHVLYSKIRPALQKVALPDFAGVCSADMYPLLPNTELISREFLALSLLSPRFTQYAVDNSDRNAMPKINRTVLNAYEMPVPDKDTQAAIVRELFGLKELAERLAAVQAEITAELDSFTPALLAKAFRGEL